MKHRSLLAAAATVGLIVAACSSGGATSAPSSAPPASTAPSTAPSESAAPTSNLPTSIGKGEGELNIVIWPGYAEDGTNVKEYDWVHPFEAANTDCKVNIKPANTSDEMVTLMRQGGACQAP